MAMVAIGRMPPVTPGMRASKTLAPSYLVWVMGSSNRVLFGKQFLS